MHMKIIVSAATLAIALGFGGAAFAQAVTLGAQTVTEANMPQVQARCDELHADANAAVEGSENSDDATATADAAAAGTATGATAGSGMGTTGGTSNGNSSSASTPGKAGTTTEGTTEQGTEEGTAGLIEIDSITLEQCVEAGLVTN
ncbi:hypothetical protein [Devosia psychrophila]|jgi:hypothetical protein|uniref:Secreted protein n=2 Tax=Devosia psychrophila TaxID=728005 RepID=A0A1I1PFQ0_9HYPH|nr:hypothetical protein [Devosia psychrophila]SFD08555.1 hypothetical protein SAMN04488059_12039 [Devosia psychrophila]